MSESLTHFMTKDGLVDLLKAGIRDLATTDPDINRRIKRIIYTGMRRIINLDTWVKRPDISFHELGQLPSCL